MTGDLIELETAGQVEQNEDAECTAVSGVVTLRDKRVTEYSRCEMHVIVFGFEKFKNISRRRGGVGIEVEGARTDGSETGPVGTNFSVGL